VQRERESRQLVAHCGEVEELCTETMPNSGCLHVQQGVGREQLAGNCRLVPLGASTALFPAGWAHWRIALLLLCICIAKAEPDAIV
jgi:hypothetical protein